MHDKMNSKITGIILLLLTAIFILYPLIQQKTSDRLKFKSPYSVIIFNLDGILINTENLKFLAWQKTFANYGLPLTLEEYQNLFNCEDDKIALGMNSKNNTHFPKERLIQEKNAYYQNLYKFNVPQIRTAVLAVHELLELKNSLNIKLALTTTAPRSEVLYMLKFIGLDNAFDVLVSGDDLIDIQDPEGINKPKPYIYQRVAEQLKIEPQKCLVFDDSEVGVEAALNAQMSVIAIPNQFTKYQNFSKAMARLNNLQQFDIYELK